MRQKVSLLLVVTILFIGLPSFKNEGSDIQPPPRWEKLGMRVVNYGAEKDVIMVTGEKGGFTKLKVEVTGGAINMHRMVVTYGNGTKDEIPLRHNFAPGTGSRVIDLEGGRRIIRKITFVYDTKNLAKRRAVVHVFGRH